jgi:ABC-type transport system involved in multi-copper enzyme maturation permease subunit
VPEKVTISHRGARYEIGRGKRYYGIWATGAPESDPIDRWPETRDGWVQAWTRFTAIEEPGTIVAVSRPRAGLRLPRLRRARTASATITDAAAARRGEAARALAGAGLLGFGVLLGLIGLFPGYVGSASLASQPALLVPHLLYLAVWAVSAALIAGGLRSRPGITRTGALLGTGLSAVTFGLFFTDLGQVIAEGAGLLGAGLVLSLLGWAACAAGSAIALTAQPAVAGSHGLQAAGGPVRPRAYDAGPVALLLLAAVGTVAAFVPSWDSYTLAQASTGSAQTVTAGNAFANPGPMIAGNVAVMAAVVAVAVLAALWRPARQGAVLLAGAIVPLAAQAVSALIQVSEPTSPSLFGISPGQASAAGLTISAGVTPIFWVYCVFVISLLISCAWMFATPQYPAMPAPVPVPDPGSVRPSQSVPGEATDSSDTDSGDGAEDDEESTYA